MRILIAGANGAIGRPLVRSLRAKQHEVFALARSIDSAPALKEIGAEPVIADALDAAAVKAAVGLIRPDAVINELTSLPRHYTPADLKAASERDRKVRVEGNINLLAALRDSGVRRYLLQSSGFWYAPGAGLADESVPFISSAPPGVEAGARTYMELEARASATPGIEFVALRYGFFYGPGTWYTREGDMGDQVRQQRVPVIAEGQGVYSFVLSAPRGVRGEHERDGTDDPIRKLRSWAGRRADGHPSSRSRYAQLGIPGTPPSAAFGLRRVHAQGAGGSVQRWRDRHHHHDHGARAPPGARLRHPRPVASRPCP